MSKQPWDKWYGHSSWRRRRRLQLQQYPLCAICLAQGRSVTATVVDHVTPHKGDWNSFKLGRLQSLCTSCHNSVKQNVERHGFDRTIGADGMPIDKNHPCYRGTTRKPETEPPPPLDLKTLIS